MQQFTIGEDEAGRRLDVALAELSALPRAQIKRLIESGHIKSSAQDPASELRPSQRVQTGETFYLEPETLVTIEAVPEALPLSVLFEDAHCIVVDKAAGQVVHPSPGHPRGTLVNALLHHCRDLAGIGGALRPGIVHRLDRGTSGVMVVAKHDAAHLFLSEQFHDHTIERIYNAWVRALPGNDEGLIERSIGRHPRDRKRMSVHSRQGRPSATRYQVCERFRKSEISRLDVFPQTGRTHQIRVHLSACGLPILGDPVYGRRRGAASLAEGDLARPALHARRLGFRHPESEETMVFEAELPDDLAALEERLHSLETTAL